MRSEQLYKLTSSVLVHTSQMAYVEEAAGTHALLEDYSEVFRYLTRKKKSIIIQEELIILQKYIHLQSIRFPSRFEISPFKNDECENCYIISGAIIEFFDNVLSTLLESMEHLFTLHLSLSRGSTKTFNIRISTNLYENLVHKQLELPDAL